MAINSEDLTIDYKALRNISVSNRISLMQQSPEIASAVLNSLTPIQIANAFPNYFRKQLPDVSNFITSNIEKKQSGNWNQTGGGTPGTAKPEYTQETNLPAKNKIQESKVAQILKKAGITQVATGQMGVTSALQTKTGKVISTATTSLTTKERALLDTISIGDTASSDTGYWESPNYNTLVYGGEFQDYSKHPGIMRKGSSAAGRYQFTETTWNDVLARYNRENPDNPITDFSPTSQDRAALYLAKADYKRRTGRDLYADMENPPENFGKLLKYGLGGEGTNTTWQAFQMKSADTIGSAFNSNVQRNEGYSQQEIAAAARKEKSIGASATPELMKAFEGDSQTQEYFAKNPEVAKKIQEAIDAGKLTVKDVSSIITSGSDEINNKKVDDLIGVVNQNVNLADEDVMTGKKPFIDGSEFAVPIYTNAKGGKRFDENLEGLTPEAIERLKQQAIAAKAAGLDRLEISGAQDEEGHASHGAGTETDTIGYNPDGTLWNSDQRALTALGAVKMGGANRAGLYGSGRVLHTGKADEVAGGPRAEGAWGPGGKTSGVSVGEFNPGLERDLAAYLKGEGPMPESPLLTEHLEKIEEAKKKQAEGVAVAETQVPTFRTGGTPYTQDDENLSVIDESGNLRWKMNSGEGVSIKPESNQYADEKLDELSGKIDEISKQFETGAKQPQSQTSAASRPTADKLSDRSDTQWSKNITSGYKPAGTQQRAFSRAQFRNEGRHIGDRGSPNIS